MAAAPGAAGAAAPEAVRAAESGGAGAPAPETARAESGVDAARPDPATQRLPGWLVVGVPAATALVVGGYRLGGASLWRDEAYTLDASRRSPGQILGLLLHVDAVHGPYYLAMHVVIGVLGTSAAALRLPSLLATSLAAGGTAALGRRLARMTARPAAGATGLLAGLLFVAAPQTTYYAQDARPCALATLFAVAASYLLVVAAGDGRRRWWAAYAAAVALAGMASLFALLLVAAHGVTLLLARERARLRPWLGAVAAALAVLSPLIFLGYRQDRALGWVTRPGVGTLAALVSDFAGSRQLITLVIATAGLGVASGLAPSGRIPSSRGSGITVVTVALPWLVLPPLVLLAVSLVKPVYVERYVVFGQPALALLSAAGVAWLAGLVAASRAGRRIPALAWAAPLAIAALLAAMVVGPQQAIRLTSARPDNLREVSAVLAANERPGDAVLYVPSDTRVVSTGYPAAFRRLRDLALEEPATESDTLTGVEVPAPALAGRLAGIRRVWLVQWADQVSVTPGTEADRDKLALVRGLRLVRRWTVQSVVLSLYAAGQP